MTAAAGGAILLFIGVTLYSVLGGADFGAGCWDLVAGGARRGARPRALIDHSIGPVWEANHVWLIFVLVILWTAFPQAFASVFVTLFVPLSLAALGIVLRGSGFAFRHAVVRTSRQRLFGATFALSSVIVPFCMGAVAGAIASGRVPASGAGDPWGSWLNPTSMLGGVLAVVTCAYIAAVYLTGDAQSAGDSELHTYFRRRALGTGVVAGAVALAGIAVLHSDAPYLFGNVTSRALPLVVVSAVAGLSAMAFLLRHHGDPARVAAALAVATVIWGWAVAQWPYMFATSLTIDAAAAPSTTLVTMFVVAAMAGALVLPSLGLLLYLSKRQVLEETPRGTPPAVASPSE